MTDKDILFKDLTRDELAVKPQDEIAHFGWGGTGDFAFMLTADAYFESAETLYEKMRSVGMDFAVLDGHIYAMVFLYRHFIELYLKGLYFKYSGADKEDLKRFLHEVGHDLRHSWAKVKPFLSKGKKHVGSKENIGAVEHYILAMNDFDSNSMVMRYPINKDLDKMHASPKHLDYVNLHDRMVEFHKAIHQIDYDIENQVLEIAKEEEITDFINQFYRLKPILDRYVEALEKEVHREESEEESGDSMGQRLLHLIVEKREKATRRENGEEIEDDHDWIYENNGDDFIILVETLFYTARGVRAHQINLTSNPSERSMEFVTRCIDTMKGAGMLFGKPVDISQTNVFSKSAEAIFENITTAVSLLPTPKEIEMG